MATPRVFELLGVPVPQLRVPRGVVRRWPRQRQVQSGAPVANSLVLDSGRREDHPSLPHAGHLEHPAPSESGCLEHPRPSDSSLREHLPLPRYGSLEDLSLLDSGCLGYPPLDSSGPDDLSLQDWSLQDFASLDLEDMLLLDYDGSEDVPPPVAEEEAPAPVLPAVQQEPQAPEQQSPVFTDTQLEFLMAHGFVEPPLTYLDVVAVLSSRGSLSRLVDRLLRLVPPSDPLTTFRSSLEKIFTCCATRATLGTRRMVPMHLIQAEVYLLLFNCIYSIMCIGRN